MKRSDTRTLTTHVGSLVRSERIIDWHIRRSLGEAVDQSDLQDAIREGVTRVVKQQSEVGIDIIDDGEFGKLNWIAYLGERLEGFVTTGHQQTAEQYAMFWPEQNRFGEFYKVHAQHETTLWMPPVPSLGRYKGHQSTEYTNLVCRGPLRYKPAAVQRDIAILTAALSGARYEEAFMPVVAPGSIELATNEYYASAEEYLMALAGELNKEYRLIVDAGFVLQVDDAVVPAMYYYRFLGRPLSEYLEWAELRIAALNRALEGIPTDRVRYHVCFGSQNIPHTTDPSLRDLIVLVLKVNAQGFAIEASNPRHEHEWMIWRDVKLPPGKILIPGVIGHATNIVEHPELIAHRIMNFASLVGRENVIASTDCGFSQGWNSPRVHVQVQWAKLQSLVEGARLATRHLWGRASA
jgi:5-methyltetrahydropteroyltriglutamate--homocysteine methyltransferase